MEKSGGQELRELVHAWELLTAQRKQKVLEYVRDQRELSARERYADPNDAPDSTEEEK